MAGVGCQNKRTFGRLTRTFLRKIALLVKALYGVFNDLTVNLLGHKKGTNSGSFSRAFGVENCVLGLMHLFEKLEKH